MWFAVGVLISFALSLVLGALVSPLRVPVLNLAVLPVGFLVGGALAGRSLRVGRRGIVGFAVAFAVVLPVLLVRLTGIQGLGGNEGFVDLLLFYGLFGPIGFALMGVIGVAIAGLGGREVGASLVVFGAAGLLGGVLMAVFMDVQAAGAPTTNLILTVLGSVAFLVLPAAIGGAWLARRLSRERERRDKDAIANRIATLT